MVCCCSWSTTPTSGSPRLLRACCASCVRCCRPPPPSWTPRWHACRWRSAGSNRCCLAGPARACRAGSPIMRLWHERLAAHPDAPAFVWQGQTTSYAELERRAAGVARALRAAGVRPGAVVAVYLERSLDLVAAFLAVLKVGGIYLPLDPALPAVRLRAMIADSGAELVLRRRGEHAEVELGTRSIAVDDAPVGHRGRRRRPYRRARRCRLYSLHFRVVRRAKRRAGEPRAAAASAGLVVASASLRARRGRPPQDRSRLCGRDHRDAGSAAAGGSQA